MRSVRGAVVDVAFDEGVLPRINTALAVEWDRPESLVLEDHSHVDPSTVRAIAPQATSGLARGTRVRAVGAAISVPVGDAVLGRLLDVVGVVRDRGPALPDDVARRGLQATQRRVRQEDITAEIIGLAAGESASRSASGWSQGWPPRLLLRGSRRAAGLRLG